MGSLSEGLERREAETRARVEELRGRVEELTRRIAAEEERLTRLRITRETVDEVLAETAAESTLQAPDDGGPVGQKAADASVRGTDAVIGVQTVPSWRPGLEASVLPTSYQDLLEVGGCGWPVAGEADRRWYRAGQRATLQDRRGSVEAEAAGDAGLADGEHSRRVRPGVPQRERAVRGW